MLVTYVYERINKIIDSYGAIGHIMNILTSLFRMAFGLGISFTGEQPKRLISTTFWQKVIGWKDSLYGFCMLWNLIVNSLKFNSLNSLKYAGNMDLHKGPSPLFS